jgi:hypothetical protein
MGNDYHSTYVSGDRRADLLQVKGEWAVDYFVNNVFTKQEIYKGHSRPYAERAAENYVDGVKDI